MSLGSGPCECETCGSQFHGEIWRDSEWHEGHHRVEYFPEESECEPCRGLGQCEGCKALDASTRWVDHGSGKKEAVAVMCSECWAREEVQG